jgi:hypothetical protein
MTHEKGPWDYWRCPTCNDGNGEIRPDLRAMACGSCGRLDDSSALFKQCAAAAYAVVARRMREAEATRPATPTVVKVERQKPYEWLSAEWCLDDIMRGGRG